MSNIDQISVMYQKLTDTIGNLEKGNIKDGINQCYSLRQDLDDLYLKLKQQTNEQNNKTN